MGLFSGIEKGVNRFGRFVEQGVQSGIDQITGAAGAQAATEAAEIQANEMSASREMFRPIIEGGIRQIPYLEESATAEGFGNNIGDILSGGALDPLIAQRQRSADAYMSQAGLRRSGAAVQEAANIPADLSMKIEGELNRRRQSIAGQGQTGAGTSANISQLIAEALAGGKLGAQQSKAAGTNNLLSLGGDMVAALSDMRYKEDVSVIGQLGGVNVIDWRWNDKAFVKYGLKGRSTGFSADEVNISHPHMVDREPDGTMRIDYDGLIKELTHAG